MNMDIWVVGITNQLWQNSAKLTGETPFFVKGPFSPHTICH